jgi:NADPH-dependent 2,4-dienoyl-CoA reductase/sulfur reductase-like enzyme
VSDVDLLIVGAGPAGMAAAVTAQRHGLEAHVVDEQPAPGGQIWRSVETAPAAFARGILGAAYQEGRAAAEAFRSCGAGYEPGTQLWQIEPGFRGRLTRDGEARTLVAKAVVLATGAQERAVPFPGWTLPGVLTVGAAQILLKSAGEIPVGPVWIVGSGPLPLLYLVQLSRAGGKVAGYLDTTPPGQWRGALRHLPRALRAAGDLYKGLGWMAALRRSGVPVVRHGVAVEAIGHGRLEALRFNTPRATGAEFAAQTLLVHEGVIPSIHPALSLGCAVDWNQEQDCYVPRLDGWGESSQNNVFIAGDGAGIAGARAAQLRGELAALRVAVKLGRLSEATAALEARPIRRRLARELALRPFLDALYKPRAEIFAPKDETIVCRCEEITAREIRELAGAGQPGPNQIKTFTRAGMGPCQGRLCGYTVTRILAETQQRPVAEVGFFHVRPPLKPVTLGELARLHPRKPSS